MSSEHSNAAVFQREIWSTIRYVYVPIGGYLGENLSESETRTKLFEYLCSNVDFDAK